MEILFHLEGFDRVTHYLHTCSYYVLRASHPYLIKLKRRGSFMGFQYVERLHPSLIFYLLMTRSCFAKLLRMKCKLSQRYYNYMLSLLDNVLILKNHQSISVAM